MTSPDGAQVDPDRLDLRTRKRLRTRRAIREAALQLFAEQGYESTTVAQIAATAEIGERTFFVYFPTKEDVLFNSAHEGFVEFEHTIAGAPSELSDLSAIEHALVARDQEIDRKTSHRMIQWLVQAAETSAVVRGKRIEYANSIASAAARGVAKRHDEDHPSAASVTIAEVAMRMFNISLVEWAAAGPDDMVTIVRARFDALRAVVADPQRV